MSSDPATPVSPVGALAVARAASTRPPVVAAARGWIVDLLQLLAPALVPAWRRLRWRGVYLCVAAWGLRSLPVAIVVPDVGRITTREEAVNYIGNILCGDLRETDVEQRLAAAEAPLVIDVGVNVGVTARWWLSRSPHVRVVGIDMMQEAVAFTEAAVRRAGWQDRFTGITGAAGAAPARTCVRYGDPLSGTNALAPATGPLEREVIVRTLDEWLDVATGRVTLLKIDVEGAAAAVLRGAAATLDRCDAVVFEGHDAAEVRDAVRHVMAHGFALASVNGRNYWFRREAA